MSPNEIPDEPDELPKDPPVESPPYSEPEEPGLPESPEPL